MQQKHTMQMYNAAYMYLLLNHTLINSLEWGGSQPGKNLPLVGKFYLPIRKTYWNIKFETLEIKTEFYYRTNQPKKIKECFLKFYRELLVLQRLKNDKRVLFLKNGFISRV